MDTKPAAQRGIKINFELTLVVSTLETAQERVAVLIFLTGTARARIVRVDLLLGAALRCIRNGIILIGSCHLRNLLTLDVLLNTRVVNTAYRILLDRLCHRLKHVVCCHLILDNGVLLAVSLQTDTLILRNGSYALKKSLSSTGKYKFYHSFLLLEFGLNKPYHTKIFRSRNILNVSNFEYCFS